MPVYRCNKCGHVSESGVELTGTSVACPACGNATPAYDTVLFVRKVLQQYFALRDELQRLQAAQPGAVAPAATAHSAAASAALDLHNTDQLASDAQHAAILDWFQRRQIQVRTNPDAVNTTGFFDEIAVEIGDNYGLYGEVIDKIRWGQQKDVPTFSLKLAERSQKDGQAINAFCKRLYDHTFLAKYYYQKPDKIGRVTLQSAPNIRRFFAGEWLEWFALMKLLAFFQEKQRAVSCTRNLSVVFPNEDLHELDVFFLVDGATPVCIECKTGEFRQEIDKYLRLSKRLGVGKERFIVCSTDLTEAQAQGLTAMYDLSFVNLQTLKKHLQKII